MSADLPERPGGRAGEAGGPLECPDCGRRYREGARICACGMLLVRAEPDASEPELTAARARARKIRPELTRGRLVRVAYARNQAEAELVENILLEEGVASVTQRSAGFDVPDFLAAGPRDVLVPESGVEVARMTLAGAGIEASTPPARSSANGSHVLRVALAVAGGAGIAALIAWALGQAAH